MINAPQPKALPFRQRLRRNERKPKAKPQFSPLQTAILQKKQKTDGENFSA